jgi:hypothetical protein
LVGLAVENVAVALLAHLRVVMLEEEEKKSEKDFEDEAEGDQGTAKSGAGEDWRPSQSPDRLQHQKHKGQLHDGHFCSILHDLNV